MSARSRLARALATALAAGALAGCASLMPVAAPGRPPAPAAGPTSGAAAPVPAPRTAASTPARTAIDTTAVSPAGRAVLETVPEPLPAAERVPAPSREEALAARAAATAAPPANPGVSAPAPGAADDSLRTAAATLEARTPAAASTDSVPVPAPTQPLGDKPGTLERLLAPDTTAAAAPAAPPPAAPPAKAPPVKAPPAAPAGCWRVQVGAPAEKARATGLCAAATSQLMVPFVVEHEKGLYKVRTRGCVDGDAAESLKRRATLAGFTGVFRFPGGPR